MTASKTDTKNINWKHPILFNLSVFFLYACAWQIGWFVSQNLETITGLTSWFLPAGIRASALLLIPRKYWWSIVLSEISCIYLVNLGDPRFSYFIGAMLATFPPILIYMICINRYLDSEYKVRLSNLPSTVILLGYLTLAAASTSILLAFSLTVPEQISLNQILPTLLSYMMGDLVGILLVLPLCVITLELVRNNVYIPYQSLLLIIISLIVALIFAGIVLANKPEVAYHIQLLAFIPIVYLAYRYGWAGVSLGIIGINILVVVTNMFVIDFEAILSTQFYLIILSMTGLLLGAAISQQKEIDISLKATNKELNNVITQLSQQVDKNAKLARKVVSIQESERKMISRELHDDVGQSITALKTHLTVVRKLCTDAIVEPALDAIDEIADAIYGSVYHLMHLLRPRVLDDLGFEAALTGENFRFVLSNAGIEFNPNIEGDIGLLNEELKLAIYRITQECINNAIKYSDAKQLTLNLHVTDLQIDLYISDDGVGFNAMGERTGSGIQGIDDRVTALAGSYHLISSDEGTFHHVQFMT